MREIRSSGSVEGVMGNHDSYSDRGRPLCGPHGSEGQPAGQTPQPPQRKRSARLSLPLAGAGNEVPSR